ncbi:serine protease [Marixanthomonas spongiae]|uniref:Serine protease n=2 Tax=Marixanthomonas spongiae TaxID=2174845 RepID=A0A2U0HXE6_9FLAO|nr:serine protease [Marixanthomonas spongiae]
MKRILFLLIALITTQLVFSQEDALVFFADKEGVADALANPITILTQEAIDRKQMHGTPIDERDVPVNESYKTQVNNSTGITVLAKSKWMNAVYVRGSISNINNLLNLDFVTEVEFADKDLNFRKPAGTTPDKFEIENQQSRIEYNYGNAANQTEMLSVDFLHENNFTGEGMVVAFMDGGFPNVMNNPAFENLRNEGRLLGTYDFVERQENVDGTSSHGSHTLSDAAAFLNGEFVGTAPNASYYLFVTEDGDNESPLEEALWVEALERADSLGVDVVNTSLGYQDFDDPDYNHSYEDLDGQTTIGARGANHAFDKGMILVTSAGNDGYYGFTYVGTPGDAPGMLTIGAVDAYGNLAYFSSIGPTVDGRVKPDVMAQGESAAIVDLYGSVTYSNGTSFSSPIMAGSVASFWQVRPETPNIEIMQMIRESGSLYDNPTDEMGYGIPNFEDAYNALIQLSVEDEMLQKNFALYPNPVTTDVNISFPKGYAEATFTMYNILGEQVKRARISANNNQVDVSQLTAGVYIATVETGNKKTSFKLIKQ